MSDEEIFADEEAVGGQELEVGQKVGFLPAIVLVILKWVALGIAAIIFIVVVVFLTLRVMAPGAAGQAVPVTSPEYEGQPPVMTWYKQIPQIRTSIAGENAPTLSVEVQVGHTGDTEFQNELTARTPRLLDIIRSYFRSKTEAELQNEEQVKLEIKERLNRVLISGRIEDIVFVEFMFF